MESKDLAVRIAQVLDKKKADSLKVLKVRDLTVLTDYFVIATGSSTTHVRSLAEEAEYQLGLEGEKPLRSEGWDTQRWILLDYGDIVIHLFDEENRLFYDLERIWRDGKVMDAKELKEEQ